MLELFILLFADDIVLLSDTIVGLQNQLDVLARSCARLDLRVYLDKTKLEMGDTLPKERNGSIMGRLAPLGTDGHQLGRPLTRGTGVRVEGW